MDLLLLLADAVPAGDAAEGEAVGLELLPLCQLVFGRCLCLLLPLVYAGALAGVADARLVGLSYFQPTVSLH
jgi:hypothetical protein